MNRVKTALKISIKQSINQSINQSIKLYLSRVTHNNLSTNKIVALLNVLKIKNLL